MMGVIKYTDKERDLLARLMRAEAIGEGSLGMLMVGNVVVNRALATCLTFKNITTVSDVIYLLSITGVFCFLSVRAVEKRRWS